jgi:hypothetical protein
MPYGGRGRFGNRRGFHLAMDSMPGEGRFGNGRFLLAKGCNAEEVLV